MIKSQNHYKALKPQYFGNEINLPTPVQELLIFTLNIEKQIC